MPQTPAVRKRRFVVSFHVDENELSFLNRQVAASSLNREEYLRTLIVDKEIHTTPSHSKSSDPFWEKSETALLQALMLYLLHEAPPEEQNFSMVMEMIAAAEVHEDDDNYQSPLDILFERLEMREPDSIACKQYRIFKQAAGDICSK